MKEVIILHNPHCSKSRATLEILVSKGLTPKIIEYLKDELSLDFLKKVTQALSVHPREILRTQEEEFKDLALDLNNAQDVLQAIQKHPRLLERPIVLAGGKAAIGRPPENVLKLFNFVMLLFLTVGSFSAVAQDGELFSKYLKTCTPHKSTSYYQKRAHLISEIHGWVDGKCRVTFTQQTKPLQQICRFDRASLALMNKDPKKMTTQEQALNRSLHSTHCTEEIMGSSPEAMQMRKASQESRQYFEKQDAGLEKHVAEGLSAELMKLKLACKAGEKKSCEELELALKQLSLDCKKAEKQSFCQKITYP